MRSECVFTLASRQTVNSVVSQNDSLIKTLIVRARTEFFCLRLFKVRLNKDKMNRDSENLLFPQP